MLEKDTQKFRLRLWKIFISTLYLSTFTFGGGYVIVTLMKKKFVDEYHWIPFVIISVISICYNAFRSNFFVAQMLSGMQAGVGAVIASVTYDMGAPIVKEKDPMSLVILLGAFLAACILEINVIYIVIVCGLLGVARTLLAKRRTGK